MPQLYVPHTHRALASVEPTGAQQTAPIYPVAMTLDSWISSASILLPVVTLGRLRWGPASVIAMQARTHYFLFASHADPLQNLVAVHYPKVMAGTDVVMGSSLLVAFLMKSEAKSDPSSFFSEGALRLSEAVGVGTCGLVVELAVLALVADLDYKLIGQVTPDTFC